ncbi:hypothetical protein MKW98_030436 [Papaver atlanticum]|uniref:Phosphomannomutase n=1 Tax=Papaver atlanticum TaxID=357466 RepID=A0AAD4XKR5_9MAGN|nr:hypothetical protein MKW98_030436 [Papaver atlanticum]
MKQSQNTSQQNMSCSSSVKLKHSLELDIAFEPVGDYFNRCSTRAGELIRSLEKETVFAMVVGRPGLIALFDVDGTLTAPRKEATPKMLEFMRNQRKEITVGVVGESDLVRLQNNLET